MAATEAAQTATELTSVVVLLAAGVIAVPLFKRAGLGSVLGYLTAGLVIGPFGLKVFTEPSTILHIAELGVVMFLFIIGLEMQPSRLWSLRKQIFGLGSLQVAAAGGLLTLAGVLAGFPLVPSFIGAMGFTLTSTAVVMQILEERGDQSTPFGQQAISILLLEDLMIVPLLAIAALLAPVSSSDSSDIQQVVFAIGALGFLFFAGRWVLNPMFNALAQAEAREVMTAAALLVVLGAAMLMQFSGLSMAMGAFVAGVLLSESTFRHQLEADIEPFRGILLGLFFIAVGMSLDISLVKREWMFIVLAVLTYMFLKGLAIYLVARATKSSHNDAIYRTMLFAQGGEFAFVLYAAAANAKILTSSQNAALTATVILSMALTPLLVLSLRWLLPEESGEQQSLEGVEKADGLEGSALIIGFGRFGQVASQHLLARGIDVSIIERDVEMITAAADFGFKVYYGDGTRLDVLRTSGAGRAEAVLVCVDKADTANRIVELCKAEFPLTKLYVRAYDRTHALQLIKEGVDYQIRETLESAARFGEEVLIGLGVPPEEAAEITADNRRRDEERLELQLSGGLYAGMTLLRGNISIPTPLTRPKREGKVVDADTSAPIEGPISSVKIPPRNA